MERGLTEYEIRYLLDHLAPMYTGADLSEFLVIEESLDRDASGSVGDSPQIFIPASSSPYLEEKVITIGAIPVLFPCSTQSQWYSQEGISIRFHHDILKSAFYLLSGYQEYNSRERDEYDRFPWEASIQYQLGITGIPVVNYYFEVILEAFTLLCQINGLPFQKVDREAPVLFLSHDVDRIKKYSFRNMVYMWLQFPGIIPSENKLPKRFWNLVDYTLGYLLQTKDPYWNFKQLMDQEKRLGIRSTWFFLEKRGRKNSRYHFSNKKIKTLIGQLTDAGHEIGIHGTMQSSINREVLDAEIQRLRLVCKRPVEGIRQHFLKYRNPLTPQIHEEAGLQYDATLGFAGQIGFRNSFAGPFRLFDFERNKAWDVWELPLNVMDVTLLNYMNLPAEAIVETLRPLMEEVSRFNGVLAILWHNCNLDEDEFPGINEVYEKLLEMLLEAKFEPLTGAEIIGGLKSAGA